MTLGVETSRMPESTVVESCEISEELGHFAFHDLNMMLTEGSWSTFLLLKQSSDTHHESGRNRHRTRARSTSKVETLRF